ncbi:hypothetical protein [uncultured Apibacter sp.]|uniref:hypothetical protein n=1 Tax=uncultured Apibacter sp. TaxID=1778616 RepID=UPI0025FC6693|nr:hypothetical protein [uncultured Apibacter sp.]
MKKILLLQFYLFFLILSCQGKMRIENEPHQVNEEEKNGTHQVNEEEKIEIKKDTMKDLDIKSMKEMLDKEYDNIDANIPSEENCIKWLNSEIYKSLLKNGYKTPSLEDFQLKMQTIFGINLKIKQPCKWDKKDNEYITLYGKTFIEDKKSGSYKNIPRPEFYEFNYTGNIFFMLDNHFMSFIIFPVRIVDFPLDSTSYKVKIPQEMISRNKYLLNNDKSQFSWLINNDENFMRSLVTTYGYTEDKKLLEWVLENTKLPRFYKEANYESLKELSKLLWTKECNGNIRVHQNTLELIKELSTPDKDLYIMYIAEYVCHYMVSFPFKEEELTFEQKAKVMAYLLYFGEQYKYDKHYDYNQMFMTNFYNYNYQIDSYEKEFIKNNYYGLPKFKEWYEAAKKEKDYFEGRTDMEDDPHPIDYKHLSNPIK